MRPKYVVILNRDEIQRYEEVWEEDQPISSIAEIVESHLHDKSIIYVESCSNSSFAHVLRGPPRGQSQAILHGVWEGEGVR